MNSGHEVYIFHDPSNPNIKVGESTTPHIGSLIKQVTKVKICDLENMGIASFKAGVKFYNWGVGETFKHNFNDLLAFHFETSDFNPYINHLIENFGGTYIPEKVNDYMIINDQIIINDHTFDFAIFASGWQQDSCYVKPFFETVNAGVLHFSKKIDEDSVYTLHEATEDGWQFGLPFPKQGITKHGYLFNTKYSSMDEIKYKLQNKDIRNVIIWEPRYSRRLIQNKFVAHNGNRLFFLEPLQALSLFYYKAFAEKIASFLSDRNHISFHEHNQDYIGVLWAYQLSLAFHYQFGSIHNTPYWENISVKAKNLMNPFPFSDPAFFYERYTIDQMTVPSGTPSNKNQIGIFNHDDLMQLYEGFTGQHLRSIGHPLNLNYE
jgi:hypothetical protein